MVEQAKKLCPFEFIQTSIDNQIEILKQVKFAISGYSHLLILNLKHQLNQRRWHHPSPQVDNPSNRSTNALLTCSLPPKTWKQDLGMLLHYHLRMIYKLRTNTGHTCTHCLQIILQANCRKHGCNIQMRVNSNDWKHGFIKESGLEDYKLNGNQEAFGFIPKKSLWSRSAWETVLILRKV